MPQTICPQCEAVMKHNDIFCRRCGSSGDPSVEKSNTWLITILLFIIIILCYIYNKVLFFICCMIGCFILIRILYSIFMKNASKISKTIINPV